MKFRTRALGRILLAVLFLVIAGAIAVVVKDMLSERNPEYALPVLQVEYNGNPLPQENVTMDSYSWRFFRQTREWQLEDREIWRSMPAAWVDAGMPLILDFSYRGGEVSISRSYENGTFSEVEGSRLETPREPGIYTYRIEAEWRLRGTVVYYVRVRIPAREE